MPAIRSQQVVANGIIIDGVYGYFEAYVNDMGGGTYSVQVKINNVQVALQSFPNATTTDIETWGNTQIQNALGVTFKDKNGAFVVYNMYFAWKLLGLSPFDIRLMTSSQPITETWWQ